MSLQYKRLREARRAAAISMIKKIAALRAMHFARNDGIDGVSLFQITIVLGREERISVTEKLRWINRENYAT